MIKVLSVPLIEDIRKFSAFLLQKGIAHRITEKSGQQVIWAGEDNDAQLIRYYYQQFKNGELNIENHQSNNIAKPAQSNKALNSLATNIMKTPITMIFVAISIITTLCMYFIPGWLVQRWFIFINPDILTQWLVQHGPPSSIHDKIGSLTNILSQTLISGQWWRLITPIFLHFSVIHIAFNAAMFLFFGKRIEARHGKATLFILIIFCAVVSNTIQYYSGLQAIVVFGGLSGVIYGLIGFCWIRAKETHDGYGIPKGIYGFMIVWLFLGFSGVLNDITGTIANGAHAGGLLAGFFAGFISARRKKR